MAKLRAKIHRVEAGLSVPHVDKLCTEACRDMEDDTHEPPSTIASWANAATRPPILTVYSLVTVAAHATFTGRTCEMSYRGQDIVVKERGRTFVFPPGTCVYEVEE